MRPNLHSKILLLSLALSVTTGCIGLDRTMFVTKTNRGVEFASTPPTISIDISRNEGVITPQFEEGKTAAVLASFRTDSEGLFSGGVGSAFATGDAAMTLAMLYDSPSTGTVHSGTIELDQDPVARGSQKPIEFQQRDVRPLFFNTQTTLGLKIGWTNLTSTIPDSFIFGYNRKELALLPLTKSNKNSKYQINQASLLATLDYVYSQTAGADDISSTESDSNRGDTYLQYFATGNAASQLATHPEVRAAMLRRLDPTAATQISPRVLPVFSAMIQLLEETAESDPYADALLARLASKTYSMPDAFPSATLVRYRNTGSQTTIALHRPQLPFPDKNFKDLIAYIASLNGSLQQAKSSLMKANSARSSGPATQVSFQDFPDPGNTDTRIPTDADVAKISNDIEATQLELFTQQKAFSEDPDIGAAYQYIKTRLFEGG